MTKEEAIRILKIEYLSEYDRVREAKDFAIKVLEEEPTSLDDAREDFVFDVYNTLDFLPTNNEANRIIDSFDRVTKGIVNQEPKTDTRDTCKDCKYNVKAGRTTAMCDIGHRFYMREPSTFYCADFEMKGSEDGRHRVSN